VSGERVSYRGRVIDRPTQARLKRHAFILKIDLSGPASGALRGWAIRRRAES